MSEQRATSTIRNMWRLALAIIGVMAIVQELRKPPEERTWHGKVAEFVPYDFRMPTAGRIKSTYWDPEGPVITSKVFGVGWAPNFGALTRYAGNWRADPASNEQPLVP